MLYELRSATVSKISKQLNISRPNMTPLLDKLKQIGLAKWMTRKDDRRVIQIDITSESKITILDATDLIELEDSLFRLKTILLKTNT